MIGVTNKTIINRCAKLTNTGFLIPNIVNQRIRSYSLSEFTKRNEKIILKKRAKNNGAVALRKFQQYIGLYNINFPIFCIIYA